ncbi:MAG: hypothetical protein ABJP87_17465 [Bauldia litoralis]|uniref:hypothetical protein n=1 Tax=Bauldia litoralis TaxID=665467 RepID=UPI00329A7133
MHQDLAARPDVSGEALVHAVFVDANDEVVALDIRPGVDIVDMLGGPDDRHRPVTDPRCYLVVVEEALVSDPGDVDVRDHRVAVDDECFLVDAFQAFPRDGLAALPLVVVT